MLGYIFFTWAAGTVLSLILFIYRVPDRLMSFHNIKKTIMDAPLYLKGHHNNVVVNPCYFYTRSAIIMAVLWPVFWVMLAYHVIKVDREFMHVLGELPEKNRAIVLGHLEDAKARFNEEVRPSF